MDGDKRTGLMAMLVFLGLNGLSLEAGEDKLADMVLGVAGGRTGKGEVTVFMKGRSRPRSPGTPPAELIGDLVLQG